MSADLNFSSSRNALELIALKAVLALEGEEGKDLERYIDAKDPKNAAMTEWIRAKLNLSSLKFQTMKNLVDAIGLPKDKLCTHCWDGSSWGHK